MDRVIFGQSTSRVVAPGGKTNRRSHARKAEEAAPPLRNAAQRRRNGALRGTHKSTNVASTGASETVQANGNMPMVESTTAHSVGKQSPSLRHAAQRRHDSTSRGPRRGGVKLKIADFDELVEMTEAMALSAGPMSKQSVDNFDTASTIAPSSTQASPELNIVDAPTWPSLREAWSGWDFCSEKSESEDDDMWEDLPGPALPMEPSPEPENATMSYADFVRAPMSETDLYLAPPMSGTRNEPAFQHRACSKDKLEGYKVVAPRSVTSQADEDEDFEFRCTRKTKGYKKDHKGSWNKKQQEKVAGRIECKTSQSRHGKGRGLELED